MNGCALIPCQNEAGTIGPLVEAVRAHIRRVLVVDDGSRDATAQLAARAGADVLRLPRPAGKGAAVRAGLARSLAQGFTHALLLDGDGQHQPSDIPALLNRQLESGADLVVGNRMGNAGPMPWLRRQTNRAMSRALSLATGQAWPDTQCGFRLLRLDAAFIGRLRARRFEIESELLMLAAQSGWRVEFAPVACVYAGGSSRIRPLADTANWLRWWWRTGTARTV